MFHRNIMKYLIALMLKKINNSFNYVNTYSPGNLSEFFVIYSITCGRIATHFL